MSNRKHDIERYLRGEMTRAEMHALEKQALHDRFLAEALEGAEQVGREDFLFDLQHLKNGLQHRAKPMRSKVLSMSPWMLGIAASVLLVAAVGIYLVTNTDNRQQYEMAMLEKAPSGASAPIADSVASTDTAGESGATNPIASVSDETTRLERQRVVEAELSDIPAIKIVTFPTAEADLSWSGKAIPEGGENAYEQNLGKKIVYPDEAIRKRVQGIASVAFTIDTHGKPVGFKVLESLGHGCDEELVRVIKASEAWKPAYLNGRPVEDKAVVTVRFLLPE